MAIPSDANFKRFLFVGRLARVPRPRFLTGIRQRASLHHRPSPLDVLFCIIIFLLSPFFLPFYCSFSFLLMVFVIAVSSGALDPLLSSQRCRAGIGGARMRTGHFICFLCSCCSTDFLSENFIHIAQRPFYRHIITSANTKLK